MGLGSLLSGWSRHPGGWPGRRGLLGGGTATPDGAPLLLGESAPHTVVLTGGEGEAQALPADGAPGADGLGGGGPGVDLGHREEQLRVLVAARGVVPPVGRHHRSPLLSGGGPGGGVAAPRGVSIRRSPRRRTRRPPRRCAAPPRRSRR